MKPVAPELQLRAFSHLKRVAHVPLLRLCETGYTTADSTTPRGIMEASTHPKARAMRSSAMKCRCKGDGMDLRVWWLMAKEIKFGTESLHFLCYENGAAKALMALVKGCSGWTRQKSWVSGPSGAWRCDVHMKCGHYTKADRGHLQFWTWYRCVWDLGGVDEITSRPQQLLDKGGTGGKVRYIRLPLIRDSAKGVGGITGEEAGARCWAVAWSHDIEFGFMPFCLLLQYLEDALYVPVEC